jgi:hypothetical protein
MNDASNAVSNPAVADDLAAAGAAQQERLGQLAVKLARVLLLGPGPR